jgi:hypothetical protein
LVLAVSRLGPEISADATRSGKAGFFGGPERRKLSDGKALATQLECAECEQYKIFNYILKILYLGCQWKELPIQRAGEGQPETHYTRIYRIWRRWGGRRLHGHDFHWLGVEAS